MPDRHARGHRDVVVLAVVLATVAALLVPGAMGAHRAEAGQAVSLADAERQAEQLMVDLLTIERSSPGILGTPNDQSAAGQLPQVRDIRDASVSWSNAMADGACGGAKICHNSSLGQQVCCGSLAENVGYRTFSGLTVEGVDAAARALLAQFIASDAHRQNLMNARYDHVGVGVEIRRTGTFASGHPQLTMWTTHVFRDHDGTASVEVVQSPGPRMVGSDAPADPGTGPRGDRVLRVTRIADGDRFGTAAAAGTLAAGSPTPVVYIANGDSFADALSGGGAAILDGAPLLTTGRDGLEWAAARALDRLDPDRIVVLGGPEALADGVMRTLGQWAPTRRVSGSDRYATAAAIARQVAPRGASTVVVASGEGYADALAAANLSQAHRAPVLLTTTGALSRPARSVLNEWRPDRILVVGGTGAVSRAVSNELARYGTVTRLGGSDRYATAAAVLDHAGLDGGTAIVATGDDFADALAAGPLSGRVGAPLVLVPGQSTSLPPGIARAVDGLHASALVVVGGQAAVGDGQILALWRALAGHV